MVDITTKILVPATEFALMSLEEFKLATGMPSGAGATDAQLEWLIDAQSAVISTLCNRVFAKETLIESWRDLGNRRIYLTHWPVKTEDIVSVSTDGDIRLDYELDEGQGKLSIFDARNEPIHIEYTGGYNLPDEAPMALKHATALLVNTSKAEAASAALTGVRMISHKESRVMFHSPTSGGSTGGSGATNTQALSTAQAILGHFIKLWV